MPAVAICEIGVMTKGWPSALTSIAQRSCGPAVSWVMCAFMKLLAAKTARPKASRIRVSIRFIRIGTNGKTSSCGRPIHITTWPICSAS